MIGASTNQISPITPTMAMIHHQVGQLPVWLFDQAMPKEPSPTMRMKNSVAGISVFQCGCLRRTIDSLRERS